jgi:RNA polymerase sigma-70 factor (ECF subfamily)
MDAGAGMQRLRSLFLPPEHAIATASSNDIGELLRLHHRRTLLMIDTSQQSADLALVRRIAAGDQEAFSPLYDRLVKALFSMACQILGDSAEAEDTLQEVCVQIWRRASTYDPERSTVFTWAVMITRAKAIDRLRARGRRARLATTAAEEGDDTEALFSRTPDASHVSAIKDDAARVRSALQLLPGDHRRVIEMAFFGEMTHAEIAQQMGAPLGTIKARIRRGLLRLRDGLHDL